MDVDRGAKSRAKICRARCDIAKVIVVQELGLLLNYLRSATEPLEDLADISSRLHRNDTEFIFFIDPDEEGLGVIMEDTSGFWPVSLETA